MVSGIEHVKENEAYSATIDITPPGTLGNSRSGRESLGSQVTRRAGGTRAQKSWPGSARCKATQSGTHAIT